MSYELTELNRLIANLMRIGTIQQVDDATARARVTIGQTTTDWLPWVTNRAGHDVTWWRPDVGEQVVVLSPSGDTAQGIITMSLYGAGDQPSTNPNEHLTRYQDGTTLSYNRQTSVLTVNCVGHIHINVPTTHMVSVTTHDGNVTINGNVAINGNLSVSGNTSTGGNTAVKGALSAKGGISGAGGLSFEQHVHTDGDGETTQTPR